MRNHCIDWRTASNATTLREVPWSEFLRLLYESRRQAEERERAK